MQPYWSDEQVTIYHADALDVLPTLRSGTVDLVVTDPPYMIGSMSAGNIDTKTGSWADMMNSSLWFQSWYAGAWRVLRSDGAMWSFCNWRSLPVTMRAALSANIPITSLMVWDKEWIGTGGTQGLRPSYELCALMAKPDFTIEDRSLPDIWRHKVGSYKAHGHPAEKPEGLVGRIIDESCKPRGSLILDPFLGSGTTAAAARQRGMRCIGIEAEERYCQIAADRLSQGMLFTG